MMAPIIFMADTATLKRGEGGFTCEFSQMHYLIDLSVPNFNVTDCIFTPQTNVKMRSGVYFNTKLF